MDFEAYYSPLIVITIHSMCCNSYVQVIVDDCLILFLVPIPNWNSMLIVWFQLSGLLISHQNGTWDTIEIELVAVFIFDESSELIELSACQSFSARNFWIFQMANFKLKIEES